MRVDTSPARPASRPRLALVTDAIFPYHRGGKEIRTHELSRRLARSADVHVYTMKWWSGPRVRHESGVAYHAIAPLLPLYTHGRRSITQALVFGLCCCALLGADFDALEADHMPYWQLFPLWLITRVRKKRFVVTWHEAWGAEYWHEYLGRFGVIGWWIERLAMRLPDRIIAASPYTAERLRQWLGADAYIIVAPNGIDLDEVFESPVGAQRYDLVCVGRLLPHKRVDLLIDAVAHLRDSGLALTCRIIGSGPERERLEAQIQTRCLGLVVQFENVGGSQADLYSVLKGARAFVFPSEREGFGIAALEALACGLPVITTSAPDNMAQHLVARSQHGTVCSPSVEELSQAIRDALGDASSPAPVVDDWLGEFDWDVITRKVAAAVLGA